MLGVREVPDVGAEIDSFEEGLFLPVPGCSPNTILSESRDGRDWRTISANAVSVAANGRHVISASGIHAALFLTNARVAFACTHYDKGGGWRGDPISMGLFNAASKIRAAIRSKGNCLVGQVRYPWIERVGSTSKTGFGSDERIVIDTAEGHLQFRLIVSLAEPGIGAELAAEIVRRAVDYRLASAGDLDLDERPAMARLAAVEPLRARESDTKNHVVFHEMPSFWGISEKSARLAPNR